MYIPAPSTIPIFERRFGPWHLALRCDAMRPDEITAHYDAVAASWDRILARFGAAQAYRSILAAALQALPPARSVRRALDCGAGTGAFAAALETVAPSEFEMHAVDLSPRMLARIDTRFAAAGKAVQTRRADILALPYADDRFDVVLSSHVCEHLTDPSAALAEMVRVTRPGGLVVLCMSRRSVFGRMIQFRWRTGPVTSAECADLMTRAGLVRVRALERRAGFRFRLFSVACVGRVPE